MGKAAKIFGRAVSAMRRTMSSSSEEDATQDYGGLMTPWKFPEDEERGEFEENLSPLSDVLEALYNLHNIYRPCAVDEGALGFLLTGNDPEDAAPQPAAAVEISIETAVSSPVSVRRAPLAFRARRNMFSFN